MADGERRVCSACGERKSIADFYHRQSQCKACFGARCKEYQGRTRNNRNRHRVRKAEMVEYMGGACVVCGESHQPALQMHHLNPSIKEFGFGYLSSFRNEDWAAGRWKEEADKCLLVCSNCHFSIHSDLFLMEEDGFAYNQDWSAAA